MFKSGSTKLVRNLNKKHILNLVRMNRGLTAREISGITGLQISTVLYILKDFRKKELITDSGLGASTIRGGKPPQIWDINAHYGFILGAELLSSELRLVVLDFKKELHFKKIYPLPAMKEANKITEYLQELVTTILRRTKIPTNKVLGLGIGIPGSIDQKNGIVLYSQKLSFWKLPIRDMLSKLLSVPIEIDNDANAGALGIKWLYFQELETPNMIYVNIQQNFSGIGVGFIIDHKLYPGTNGAAGEIPSFLPQNFWRRVCKRLKDDCLLCNNSLNVDGPKPIVSLVIEKALNKNRNALFILREIAKEISKKIVMLIDLFNPDVVVVGGDICEARPFIEPVIIDRIKTNVTSPEAQQTRISFSPFSAYSGAYGGAALIFKNIFS